MNPHPALGPRISSPWYATPAAVSVAIAALAYFGVWTYGFASDDVALSSRLVRDGWAGIAPLLSPATGAMGSSGYEAYFRPVWVLLGAVEYARFGASAAVPHTVNLLIFLASCALLCVLAESVTGDRRMAYWAGALFAVHPIHTVNVIWISGRTDALATLGVLAALYAIIQWRVTGRRRWAVVSALATLLGLASKEMAYLLPLLAFATEWTRAGLRDGSSIRDALVGAVRAALVPLAVVVAWGAYVLLSSTFVSGFQWTVGLRTILVNWTGAIVLMAIPFDYEVLLAGAAAYPALVVIGSLVVVASMCALAWMALRDASLRWGLLWTLIGIIPLYRLTMRWYLLLPSVGVAIVFGALMRRWELSRWSSGATVVGAILVLGYAGGLVYERGKWNDADALGRKALSSLVAGTSAADTAVVVASPFKMRRMPVFGGNTESFLLVTTGESRPVHVLSAVALDDAAATVTMDSVAADVVRLEIDPDHGTFMPPADPNARGRTNVGRRYRTEIGTVEVARVDDSGRPTALTITLRPGVLGARTWLTLDNGEFVRIAPPNTKEAGRP